tara:strand:- start:532 stop:726 length:195 start_codon:yes stop_codon:yes gene_type:complete
VLLLPIAPHHSLSADDPRLAAFLTCFFGAFLAVRLTARLARCRRATTALDCTASISAAPSAVGG